MLSSDLDDPGKWVINYVKDEERLTNLAQSGVGERIRHFQGCTPDALDEAIQGGDFYALLYRYPTEVVRVAQINSASSSFDYAPFAVRFDTGCELEHKFKYLSFPEKWSERFCDWLTLIELRQDGGWAEYQKTFHATGGFALLEEIESVLSADLSIWKVWDCDKLRHSLMARRGALFHFYDTVRKRSDYNSDLFKYDPAHTIQSQCTQSYL